MGLSPGNRGAVDCALGWHKERKPRDSTIRARFDTYRFADHKEHDRSARSRGGQQLIEFRQFIAAS
jgi:hypothetical protein